MTTLPALSPAISPEREASLLASVPTGLLINGQWRDASDGGTFDVHDPATGEVLATLASATSEDALAALDAADAVQASWARTAPGCGPRSCAAPSTWSPNAPRTSRC
jgi:succinate-semialdehyde dehydrogenase/glutarate-semialdehyde dehydrogenase